LLTLEIELLTGVYRASLHDQSGAEWPPHPERVFSALVQAWGDGGERDDEREALEWLEALEPPAIEASDVAGERHAPVVYVPPNDARSQELAILPSDRPRQPRYFRAVVPLAPLAPLARSGGGAVHVRLRWDQAVTASRLNALGTLARRVASVGHSASLTRLAFHDDASNGRTATDVGSLFVPSAFGSLSVRVTYAGRLRHLVGWYSTSGGKARERPLTRATARYAMSGDAPPVAVRSVFGAARDWIVLVTGTRDEERGAPDILAFPRIARRVRDALMNLDPNGSPEIICGHRPDGAPSGAHYNLNIIGVSNPKTTPMTGGDGHTED